VNTKNRRFARRHPDAPAAQPSKKAKRTIAEAGKRKHGGAQKHARPERSAEPSRQRRPWDKRKSPTAAPRSRARPERVLPDRAPAPEPVIEAPVVPLPSAMQTVPVTADENGLRVDRFFEHRFPALSFSHIQRIIRKGEVRVNGKRVEPKDRLEAGQSVRIPPLRLDPAKPLSPRTAEQDETRAFLQSITLHEDADVLVLNKPMGLAVQGGSGTTRHLDGMLEVLRQPGPDGQRPRLVHRLDKDTAGCLLVAKTRFAAAAFGAQNLLGTGDRRAEAEAGPHFDLPRQGGARGRQLHARRPAWRGRRKPRGDLLCGGGDGRVTACLDLAQAGDGAHAPASRPHGAYWPSDHR
jgi:23S rRNA pseudouridine955/2504/2580 synthase